MAKATNLKSWSFQLVGPAGPSSWSAQLVRPAGPYTILQCCHKLPKFAKSCQELPKVAGDKNPTWLLTNRLTHKRTKGQVGFLSCCHNQKSGVIWCWGPHFWRHRTSCGPNRATSQKKFFYEIFS